MRDFEKEAHEIARRYTVVANDAEIMLDTSIASALRAAEAAGFERGRDAAAAAIEARGVSVSVRDIEDACAALNRVQVLRQRDVDAIRALRPDAGKP